MAGGDPDLDVRLRQRPGPGRRRVYYAMARDGLFFRGVATTNRYHVPAVALVAQGLWAALLALPVTVDRPTGHGTAPSTATSTASCWNTSSRST